ncbi:MAG TPA: hydrogenase maturation protease [Candidatus Obscuribacterales bacterium]
MKEFGQYEGGTAMCRHVRQKKGLLAVIGVGNSLRGDDGIGPWLVEHLSRSEMENVCAFDLGCYTSYASDLIAAHESSIIIDAVLVWETGGDGPIVAAFALADLKSLPQQIKSTHGFSWLDQVRLAEAGQTNKKIIFFGVPVHDEVWNEGLSAAMKKRLPRLQSDLQRLIAETRNEMSIYA